MRLGRRLAIDVGKARIGVASCDIHGILASGVATVARQSGLAETAQLIIETIGQHGIEMNDILEIYVGLPTNLKGQDTESTRDAISVARAIAALASADVRLVDERLTTVSAAAALRSSGVSSKKGRGFIDQIAATLILEQALAVEKASGQTPGLPLSNFASQE
jgi:putative Holliday junction resolvase